jgi:hypothetical protein
MSETITLEPADYPAPPVSMFDLVPANLHGQVDLGPTYVDAETVQALHEAVAAGMFVINPDWNDALTKAQPVELEQRFLERLRRTPLSPSSPALHHRRLALFEAVREIGVQGTIPGFGFGVHNLTRCIGDVETWLESKRQELVAQGLDEAAVVHMLAMLTPAQLGALLQTSEANLGQWRNTKVGPAYAQLSQRTIRYPVAAVLDWLTEGMRRAL